MFLVKKYLCVTISYDSKDDWEIAKQCRNIYARGNTVISNIRNCSDDVKCQLFKTFCSTFYCSPLQKNYSKEVIRCFKVAFNRIICILLNLEHRVSISHAFVTRRLDPFNVIFLNSVLSLKNRLLESHNILVYNFVDSSYFMSSILYKCCDNQLHTIKVII